MKYNVFIDGAEGTTGLKIHQYFQKREDIQVLKIEEAKRKDMEARLALIRQADISFLCLPDAAAKEIAEAAPKDCRILGHLYGSSYRSGMGVRHAGALQHAERQNQRKQSRSRTGMPCDRRDPAHKTAS